MLTSQLAERALQSAVGYVTYHCGDWGRISRAIDDNPAAAVRAFQEQIPASEDAQNVFVDDVRLLVLQGKEGPPPRGTPQEVTGTGLFAQKKRHSASAVGAFLDIFGDVGHKSNTRMYVHHFASSSLEGPLRGAQDEARAADDTYLVELDRLTDCDHQPGQTPSWVSSVVLLKIRVGGCIVLSLSATQQDGGRLEISCTSLGGNEVANLNSDTHCSCAVLRGRISQQLMVPASRLKLVLRDSGALVENEMLRLSLAEIGLIHEQPR